MRIFAPCQPPGERRVALTPEVAGALASAGHTVSVAAGAGSLAGFVDDDYMAAGAQVLSDDSGWTSDLVVSVVDPEHDITTALLALLDPFVRIERMHTFARRGATVFAFEAVPRTSRAQAVDALSSQATAVGYQATLLGALTSDRFFPMLTTAAGTIRPAKVVVLGAGVAGLQAIATARRLGAVVSAFDVRAEVAEQIESLGARFVRLSDEPDDQLDASDTGGYARELAADDQQRIIDRLADHLADADLVVTTAAIPGRPAPKLIDAAGIARMRHGAVIVDVAAATGGNTTATEPGDTVVVDGVTIIGSTDLVNGVAADASRMYAKNVANFIELLVDDDGAFAPDWDDDILAGACIARDGQLVHPRLTEGGSSG